ncbi:MAG: HAD family hydrolase [Candidatus Bathyarchaeia archaeon]
MIKAVVFDLDGTLVNFNIDFRMVRAEIRSFLISQGVPASVLSVNERIFEMLKKTEIFMKNNGKSAAAIEAVRKKALAIAEKYELEAAKTTKLQPSAKEVLETLKKAGLKIGLCTINSQKSAEYLLERFRIKDFFGTITSRDNVKHVKPNTEHLQATLKALEVSPQEVLVVGDSQADMKCAKELGATAVGILTGVSTPKELMDAGADYLVTSIADVPVLIEQINSSKPC